MIFRTIKINGEQIAKWSIPESWNEFPFYKYVQLEDCETLEDKFTVLCGSDIHFSDIPLDPDMLNWVSDKLSWSSKNPEFKSQNTSWSIGDRLMCVPEDLTYKTIGQYEDFKAVVKNSLKEGEEEALVKAYPLLCAIYLQGEIDGEYDYLKAVELSKEIEKQSCIKVVNNATFFLIRLSGLKIITFLESLSLNKLTNGLTQALAGFKRFTGSILHYRR